MSATLVEREGNAPLTDEDRAAFNCIKSFAEVVQVMRSRLRIFNSFKEKSGFRTVGCPVRQCLPIVFSFLDFML